MGTCDDRILLVNTVSSASLYLSKSGSELSCSETLSPRSFLDSLLRKKRDQNSPSESLGHVLPLYIFLTSGCWLSIICTCSTLMLS